MLSIFFITLGFGLLFLLMQAWPSLGKRANKKSRLRFAESPQRRQQKFYNDHPLRNYLGRSIIDLIKSPNQKIPREPIPVYDNDGSVYAHEAKSGLRITWLGHSNLLVELSGKKLLLDPLWGPRVSPFNWLGPKRWYESPLTLDALPPIDAVLISHDHYDHLCRTTIEALAVKVPKFIVPLGVASHLEYWGVEPTKIVEVDWWDEIKLDLVIITATPARHASGRHLFDLDTTLWAGYAITSPSHRLFYSGDSGLFDGFKEIGERLGPFDITMIETGAYSRNWPDWHMGPEQAVIANQWVNGKQLLPLHWGLYNLSVHNWTEPMERVRVAAAKINVPVITPRPGQPFELDANDFSPWWPDIPWFTANERPIVSSNTTLSDNERNLIEGRSV